MNKKINVMLNIIITVASFYLIFYIADMGASAKLPAWIVMPTILLCVAIITPLNIYIWARDKLKGK